MRIDSSGNVGIGTASPSSRLHVSSAVSGYTTSLADSVTNATLLLKTNSGDSTLTSFGGLSSGAASIQRSNGPGTSSYDIALNPFGGAVMVGATAVIQSAKLLILANSTNNNAIVIQDTGTTYGTNQWFQVFANSSNAIAGTIAHTAVTTTAYQTSSDERLKENISDADVGLEKVNQIKVRAFDWKEDKSHTDYGFIAQELYKIFPEAVGRGSDGDEIENGKGTWQVEYGRLTPLLVKAVQELSAKVDAQAAEIAELKTKIG
jgi:hypothetical protein